MGIVTYILAGIMVALAVYITDNHTKPEKESIFTKKEIIVIGFVWPLFVIATLVCAMIIFFKYIIEGDR